MLCFPYKVNSIQDHHMDITFMDIHNMIDMAIYSGHHRRKWYLTVILFAYWVIFHAFCHLQTFFKINFFEIRSECQTVWIQIRIDILSILIWVQTVCKGYKQTTHLGRDNNQLEHNSFYYPPALRNKMCVCLWTGQGQ